MPTTRRKSIAPDPLAKVSLTLPMEDALYLARAGVAAVSQDDVTPVIGGVLLSASDDTVRILATDRYRVHRATVSREGAQLSPFLVSSRSLDWLIANAGFYGRGLVDPLVLFEFEPSDVPASPVGNASPGTGTACPPGMLTMTLSEGEFDTASRLTFRHNLIRGNFPSGIETILNKAIESEPFASDDDSTLDLDFLSKCRALASFRGEKPRVRFVAGTTGNLKAGQALVTYRQGVALILFKVGELVATNEDAKRGVGRIYTLPERAL